MSRESLTIADDLVVSMEYVLRSKTGKEIERSDGPITFIQGYGEVVPGLEEALNGLRPGDEKEVVVEPDDGYGEYDEDNLQEVPRSAFPDGLELELGKGLRLRDRKTGEEYAAYVVEAGPESVTLDFNHPLAGQTLYFNVRIVDLRPATADELAEGVAKPDGAPSDVDQ